MTLKFWLKYTAMQSEQNYRNILITLLSGQTSFNTNKCKVTHVGRANQKFTYVMDGQTLDTVDVRKIWVL